MNNRIRLTAAAILAWGTGAWAVPIHVTYLWHMHQPIYYPYESLLTTDSNGRFNFNVAAVHNDRSGNYTTWPKDAVQLGADKGMDHAGAQCSFSGSLGENLNNLWGYCTSADWDNAYDWARNSLKTSLNNPRLDMVGIAYHHSLMPLTCKESMRMQIKLHKEQYQELWDTGGSYAKGFWPPEVAFAEWIIKPLVDEGLEWVLVDNIHFDRACRNYPWSDGGNILRPNPADAQNPDPGNWVQLDNIWAGTKVSAPWGYQPHYVQYVDPWSDPASPAISKIVAVPAARYEGNENGRGGYGSFKPENVWGAHVGLNNDASHPMLMVCHSDGDNYGMKNSSAWHDSHNLFLEMCKANADFDNTTVQDYLQTFPPSATDVIHVEPGSWSGADNGDPEFKKWNGDPQTDGKCPDRFSWSVLVAAQNRVILADSLENGYSLNDVEWGIGTDTARAWHYYLNGETSCYWYWDTDWGNPWNGNVTRACNQAIAEANKVLARHAGVDALGPSIFPPQRDPYNPGGYEWNETTPQPSDFQVWTFADDASGLGRVTLRWRTDKDGLNPISSVQNELYAAGNEVNAWNDIAMSGSWDPSDKGPDNIVPAPTARAMTYKATIAGQNDVLIDYFVEAVDGKGNTNRSDIMHVWVGAANTNVPQPSVEFDPAAPDGCTQVTVRYKKTGSLGGSQVYIHIGRNGWQDVVTPDPAMTDSGDYWTYVYATPTNTTAINVCFNNGGGIWDNNGDANWSVAVANCGGGMEPGTAVWTVPETPVGCDPVAIYYNPAGRPLAGAGQVYIHIGRNGWQDVVAPDPAMTASGTNWTYPYTPAPGTTNIDLVFNAVAGGTTNWDNNGGADWHVAVAGCGSLPPVPDGVVITNPAMDSITVANTISDYTLQGTAGANLSGNLGWTNALNGHQGSLARQSYWSLPVALAVGSNVFAVSGAIAGSGTTTVAVDSAAAYTTESWTNGSNAGSGFGSWQLNSVAGSSGHFIGANGWGFWSHEGDHLAEAVRPLAAPLAPGQTFRVRMKNGWIWESGGSIGVALRNSAGTTLWQLYFNGGKSYYEGSDGTNDVGWTDAGLDIALTLTGPTSYSATIQPVGGTAHQYAGSLADAVSQFRAWSYNNGTTDTNNSKRDFFVDSLKVIAPAGAETYTSDTVTIVREGSAATPSIPPITFAAGAGFWFDLPGSYSLMHVEGATELVGPDWNWTTLAAGVDYTLNEGQVSILTGGTAKRMIRIWLGPAIP